jgi:hypothetical protein
MGVTASGARQAGVWGVNHMNQTFNNIMNWLNTREMEGASLIDEAEPRTLAELSKGYDSARERYQPYAEDGYKGWTGYLDAAGVNGPNAAGRAEQNFRESPGYKYRVSQALDGVARKAAAVGSSASGNTLVALQKRAGDEADQEFGTYVDRLRDIGRVGYDASGKMAGFDAAEGVGRAGVIDTNAARKLASHNTHSGWGMDISRDHFKGTTSAGMDALKAGDKTKDDQANMWLNVAKLGAGLLGGMGGGGFGSLFGGGGGSMFDSDFV